MRLPGDCRFLAAKHSACASCNRIAVESAEELTDIVVVNTKAGGSIILRERRISIVITRVRRGRLTPLRRAMPCISEIASALEF